MYYFSVATVFKNEHHGMKEWIEHYKFHGVDHLYMINDFSTPDFEHIIQKYIDEGYVTLFHNDIVTKNVGRQTQIYENYLRNIIKETYWLAVIDMDEYLYSPSDINLKNVLKKYENYSAIEVQWIHFGSNGYIKQPDSIVESFIKRNGNNKPGSITHSYKTIIKANKLLQFNIHRSSTIGNGITLDCESNDLLINHYAVQSWEFYSKIKATRGDCDNYYDHNNLKRNRELFDKYDINEVTDERLKNQNLLNRDK